MRDKMPEYVFHGGCIGCTQQEIHNVDFCINCQYFDGNRGLEDLNNRPPSLTELKRREMKQKRMEGVI